MRHEQHGGYANLPDLPMWRALGWQPHEGAPPPEPDPTAEPATAPGPAEPEPTGQTEGPPTPAGLLLSQPAPEEDDRG